MVRSLAIAEAWAGWLPKVIQSTRPFLSKNIDKGAIWFSEIFDQLKNTTVGIICLTQENKHRPWIQFEAGALTKGLTKSRVCPFLIDLTTEDVGDPLAQLNHTIPTKESIFGLLKTINQSLGDDCLKEVILGEVFQDYWPKFEEMFKKALKENQPDTPTKARSNDEILREVLVNTRSIASTTSKIYQQLAVRFVPASTQKLFEELYPLTSRLMLTPGQKSLLESLSIEFLSKDTQGVIEAGVFSWAEQQANRKIHQPDKTQMSSEPEDEYIKTDLLED